MKSSVFFEHSAWFFILCLLAGLFYAFLMYYKNKSPWDKQVTYQLAGIRMVLVTLLAGLLVGPFLKLTQNKFENPVSVFAIDNSLSLDMVVDSTLLSGYIQDLKQLSSNLRNSGYEIRMRTFKADITDADEYVAFDQPDTDINALLKSIQNDFEGINLGSVVLLSDGIYNRGISPTFSNFTFPIFSIGVGDTTTKSDLIIKSVLYNRLSYQGNRFPVIIEIFNEGFVDKNIRISILKNNRQVDSRIISFNRNNQLLQVEFFLDAEDIGLQRYTLKLENMPGEFTYKNNARAIFIDVIEGKEKILVVAPSPHPDIKAITSAIESNENYEVGLYIPGIQDYPDDLQSFDLVIAHQVPDEKHLMEQFTERINQLNIPVFYILGSQTSIEGLNREIAPLRINTVQNQGDLVTAVYNSSFSFFNLSEELVEFLAHFPPVRVPFGQVITDIESSVLLNQRVGSIETNRPLLIFTNSPNRRKGVMFGEGLWQWKLSEYSRTRNDNLFNELILKSVQFLTTRDDKRKFRVYPSVNEFFENQPVVLEAEAYNSLYEVIYGVKIDLTVENENRQIFNYTFVTSETNSNFTIRDLESGVYKFTARAVINDQPHQVTGEFAIRNIDIESVNLIADHHLLRELSHKSGGQFYHTNQLGELQSTLINNKPPDVIHSSEQFFPLINLIWAFFLLLLLISAEWFIRKYQGGY